MGREKEKELRWPFHSLALPLLLVSLNALTVFRDSFFLFDIYASCLGFEINVQKLACFSVWYARFKRWVQHLNFIPFKKILGGSLLKFASCYIWPCVELVDVIAFRELTLKGFFVDQHYGFKPFNRSQRCKLQSYGHLETNNTELRQTGLAKSFREAFVTDNIHRSFSTPCLPLTTSAEEEFGSKPRVEMVGGRGAPVHALVVEVAIAMASGSRPIPLASGLGGAYIFRSQNGNDIAVAKPADEEPLALNNPKGLRGRMLGQPGLKRSIRIGETGIRELAAYFLDHEGFAAVPPTALVNISHSAFNVADPAIIPPLPCKFSSLQRFVDYDFDAGELGPSLFSVDSVHRIGIFDIRLLNLDRHAGNMLVKKHGRDCYATGVAELVPIDHGLCLPEWLDDPYFEWLHWPQASVPFSESETEYISKLDPFKDAELLRAELPLLRESSIRVLLVCTIFLKQAAAAGLCLAEIGQLMTRGFRDGEETPSQLEDMCSQAKASIPRASSNNKIQEESKKFQFINGSRDGICKDKGLDFPQLLQIHHVASQPRSSFAGPEALLLPPTEENDDQNERVGLVNIEGNNDKSGKCSSYTERGNAKGMSLSSWSHNCETDGISFGDLKQREWDLFLEHFEKLLSGALEDKKCRN
ncbi:hypothetical protein L6164_009275 [Bauhinia variegata]|uniref:Uncharacterized protein n=1 Tax=Bauhinia variegata TaxID=167791 RepID=A0ACB9PJC4_BAUVA|nr:hypothetical protein L6164_009275 [Bauhinia variegata]